MVNSMVGLVVVILISVVSLGIVLTVSTELIGGAKDSAIIRDAQRNMQFIDNAIKEVSKEGAGSKRVVKISTSSPIEIIPESDAMQFDIITDSGMIEKNSRRLLGDLLQLSGSDVNCTNDGNLTMENTYFMVKFPNVSNTQPQQSLNTKDLIVMMKDKVSNNTLTPVNSSVYIDGNFSTSLGTGYTEILKPGKNLPFCKAHAYVNSIQGAKYDIYYTLYSKADFIVGEVRNPR